MSIRSPTCSGRGPGNDDLYRGTRPWRHSPLHRRLQVRWRGYSAANPYCSGAAGQVGSGAGCGNVFWCRNGVAFDVVIGAGRGGSGRCGAVRGGSCSQFCLIVKIIGTSMKLTIGRFSATHYHPPSAASVSGISNYHPNYHPNCHPRGVFGGLTATLGGSWGGSCEGQDLPFGPP